MRRILITGMSGTGKSSVIEALQARGYRAVDTDYDDYSGMVRVSDEALTGHDQGFDWVWRENRIQALLNAADYEMVFLSGCAPNQGMFYPQFDHIILLTAPAEVIAERLRTRTNNPYGQRTEEINRTLQIQEMIEPLLRSAADHVIDTRLPLNDVVDTIVRIADSSESRLHRDPESFA